MKKILPGLRTMVSLGAMVALAGVFTYSVKADSTITIPVPQEMRDKQVTISLRIPPNTEPLTRDQARPKLNSKKSMIVWNSNPSPKLPDSDEAFTIFNTFLQKGWIKTATARGVARMRPMDKYYAVRLIQHISENVIEIAQAPNFGQVVKKCNLTTSDIEDLRRMIKRFEKDLVVFGSNTRKVDKDLLMLQEKFKTARQGILKVLRVEGAGDGATVIHLSVD